MMKYFSLIIAICLFVACKPNSQNINQSKTQSAAEQLLEDKKENAAKVIEEATQFEIVKSDEEWKKDLNEQEFYVIRKKGTERSFTGDLLDNKREGIYTCRACQYDLFSSTTKFKSGTGWPSFYEPIEDKNIAEDTDHDLGYARTEVMCGRCGGHLGHVFKDGPKPTGLRYCINSVSLDFVEK